MNISSLFRVHISRRLIRASYRQFYIHEKSESLRVKIKSNRSRFADYDLEKKKKIRRLSRYCDFINAQYCHDNVSELYVYNRYV